MKKIKEKKVPIETVKKTMTLRKIGNTRINIHEGSMDGEATPFDIELFLNQTDEGYCLIVPGYIATYMCVNKPADFKQIINYMVDEMIEVENDFFDKHIRDFKGIEDKVANG